ncbi:MAG: long-chain fatty acid--CoA ligase [Novosphingobium sp.]
MMPGQMQDRDLAIIDILRFAARAHPDREIVSRNVDEPLWRYGYRACLARASQAAGYLADLGIAAGDVVSSLAWNTHRHFELFYAVPGLGAVLHTANPRLSDDHLVYTINHAGSRALLFDRNMTEIVTRIRDRLPQIRHYVMLCDRERAVDGFVCYDEAIARYPETFAWPEVSERAGAFLCYTSGTTGDPKGVLYTHRSTVLHALAGGLSGAMGFSAFDVVMPCQSLYHATAWGLPFAGTINGVKFVLPADRMDGASLDELIRNEGVTFSGGVPTIWTMYLDHLRRTGGSTGSLQRVFIGGSAVPRDMAAAFHEHGVDTRQIWGMTETSPLGVVATSTPALAAKGADAEREQLWTRQGRMLFGIEIEVFDEAGQPLPHDGRAAGALKVRGPWVVERYHGAAESACDANGWFDTGDVATIDDLGFMRITDRQKDVIKSGGEWISSIDLENIAAGCPGVKVAAVVGVHHPKWEERPVILVERHEGASLTEAELRRYLEPRIARWWMPDRVIFGPVPLTATGKIDKKLIKSNIGSELLL